MSISLKTTGVALLSIISYPVPSNTCQGLHSLFWLVTAPQLLNPRTVEDGETDFSTQLFLTEPLVATSATTVQLLLAFEMEVIGMMF